MIARIVVVFVLILSVFLPTQKAEAKSLCYDSVIMGMIALVQEGVEILFEVPGGQLLRGFELMDYDMGEIRTIYFRVDDYNAPKISKVFGLSANNADNLIFALEKIGVGSLDNFVVFRVDNLPPCPPSGGKALWPEDISFQGDYSNLPLAEILPFLVFVGIVILIIIIFVLKRINPRSGELAT